jgi:hypothetical protein
MRLSIPISGADRFIDSRGETLTEIANFQKKYHYL